MIELSPEMQEMVRARNATKKQGRVDVPEGMKAAIAEALGKGSLWDEIAEVFGVSPPTVARIKRKHGGKRRYTKQDFSAEERKSIAHDYRDERMSWKALTEKYGVPIGTINAVLKMEGVKRNRSNVPKHRPDDLTISPEVYALLKERAKRKHFGGPTDRLDPDGPIVSAAIAALKDGHTHVKVQKAFNISSSTLSKLKAMRMTVKRRRPRKARQLIIPTVDEGMERVNQALSHAGNGTPLPSDPVHVRLEKSRSDVLAALAIIRGQSRQQVAAALINFALDEVARGLVDKLGEE